MAKSREELLKEIDAMIAAEEEAKAPTAPAPDEQPVQTARPTGRLPRYPGATSGRWEKFPEGRRMSVKPGMSLADRLRSFGIDPDAKRATLLPFARNEQDELEFRPSQAMVDLFQGAILPGHVAQGGSYEPEDVTKMALDWNPMPARRTGVGSARQFIDEAPTSDQLKRDSSRLYDLMKRRGVHANAEELTNTIDKIQTLALREGADEVLTPLSHRVSKLLEGEVGMTPDLNHLERMRRWIGIAAGAPNHADRYIAGLMMEKFDDYIDTLSGLPKKARLLWHRAKKTELIDLAIARAENTASGYENGLRIEFRKILRNPKLHRGFTQKELKAIADVEGGGSIRTFLRNIRHAGVAGRGENRYLGPMVGAGIGSSLGLPTEVILGTTALGTAAGRSAMNKADLAAEIARAMAASGRNPPPPILPGRRMPGILGATQIEPEGRYPRGPNGGWIINGEEVF